MKKNRRPSVSAMQDKARSLLTVETLRNGKCTLRRYVYAKGARFTSPYKSIKGMPIFDTCADAQAFRDRLCNGGMTANVVLLERDFALLQEVLND